MKSVSFYCLQLVINDKYVTSAEFQPFVDKKYVATEEKHFESMKCEILETEGFAKLYFEHGDPTPWNPTVVDIKTKTAADNTRDKDQFEPNLNYGLFDFRSSQVWLPHHAKNIFKTAVQSEYKDATFKEVLDEETFFQTIQSLDEIKFGIVPDELLNSINTISQAMTVDANCYDSSYAELTLSFNKKNNISEKVRALFNTIIGEKSSFKKIAIAGRNNTGLDMLFNTETVSTKVTIDVMQDENGMLVIADLFNKLQRFIRNEV
mgnify:CR=1 FL=1